MHRVALLSILLTSTGIFTPAVADPPHLELVHLRGNVTRDGLKVPYELKVSYDEFTDVHDKAEKYWGSDQQPSWKPRWIITKMEFSFAGKIVKVPSTAFHDLGNPLVPSTPYFEATTLVIVIPGSDGAGSYESKFKFGSEQLVERKTQDYASLIAKDDSQAEIKIY